MMRRVPLQLHMLRAPLAAQRRVGRRVLGRVCAHLLTDRFQLALRRRAAQRQRLLGWHAAVPAISAKQRRLLATAVAQNAASHRTIAVELGGKLLLVVRRIAARDDVPGAVEHAAVRVGVTFLQRQHGQNSTRQIVAAFATVLRERVHVAQAAHLRLGAIARRLDLRAHDLGRQLSACRRQRFLHKAIVDFGAVPAMFDWAAGERQRTWPAPLRHCPLTRPTLTNTITKTAGQ